MKKLVIIGFILFFLAVASFSANTPVFWPGGTNSTFIYDAGGEKVTSIKTFVKIDGKEYTQITEEPPGCMVSLLSESTYDPWGWSTPKAINNPFLVFRIGDDGIYGYSKPYLEAMASEVKNRYEGVIEISFPVGKDEIMLFSPNETRFIGIACWTVLKFTVKFQNGTKKTLEVIGTSGFSYKMDGQEIREEDGPSYNTIDYYSSDKENPAIQDFFPYGGGRHLWELYLSKRGIEGITTPGIAGGFVRKLVSANLTLELGKGKDIPPAGKTASTWGSIKLSR